ncbi:hypothetical protein BKA62DRAFT_723704 [Auriculariales sp. MPI-PUGE-AT-0066]|nr:hypothetical protein BKA62DRAFT_723704 [Auriculariales sp. MPI-PUGE-AT-0066]
MSFLSPPTALLWAVLSVLLQGFLVTHLYRFDRFKCLRWNAGQQPGAFQRVMTYTYLATMPLIILFSVALTILKYQQGYVAFPPMLQDEGDSIMQMKTDAPPLSDSLVVLVTGPIIPKPFALWDKAAYNLMKPLYIVLAVAWSFELVTHLEELNFWLFLINQGPRQKPWFKSYEFQTWVVGSLLAVAAMPVVAIISMRNSLPECEAWVVFIGSSCSTVITVMFLYVLYRFPRFLQRLRTEGAPPIVVIRLTGFHEINIIRVGFRFLFTLPLLTLAIDGIRVSPSHPILASKILTDLLASLGGIGCMVSSILTLLVFFPRSKSQEAGYNPRDTSTTMHRTSLNYSKPPSRRDSMRSMTSFASKDGSRRSLGFDATSPVSPAIGAEDDAFMGTPISDRGHRIPHHLHFRTEPSTPATREFPDVVDPPRADDIRDAMQMHELGATAARQRRPRPRSVPNHPAGSGLHPYIGSYESPINFVDLFDANIRERDSQPHV